MMRIDGGRLRAVRERRLMTLRELAEASGVTAANLSRIENERQQPEIRTVRKIATALQVTVDDLLPAAGADDRED